MAAAFFDAVLDEARAQDLLSDDHFTVDGTLLESWVSLKSFRPKPEGDDHDPKQEHPWRLGDCQVRTKDGRDDH